MRSCVFGFDRIAQKYSDATDTVANGQQKSLPHGTTVNVASRRTKCRRADQGHAARMRSA